MAFFERPNKITCCLMVLITTVFTCLSTLASPSSLTYQGRILKSDGSPLEFNNVSFIFQVMDSAGTCLVYQEQVTGYNMVNSGGVFDVPIGTGTVQFPLGGASSVLDAFNNSSSFTCGACSLVAGSYSCANGSGTYAASAGDGRKLRVQFYDGSGWKTISPDSVIRSVPFAGYALSAQKLGTNNASDFLLKTLIPTCGVGTFLSWDGTSLTCAGVAGASGGTVTNVTSANSYLSISNGASTPQLTLNVGTTANTVAAGNDPRLLNSIQTGGSASGDLSGTYPGPAVVAIRGVGISSAVPSSGQVLKFNGTNWAPASDSNAGGTVTAVSSSNSYLSVASGTSTPTLTLNVGSAANTVAAGNDARITNAVQNGSSATLTGVVLKDSGSNTATLQAPNAIGTSYVLKLPTNIASSAGQVLSSDTSGNLSWVTPSTTATSYSGVLPVANGGTNSSAALTGNKIMISSGTSIVEGSALTNGQLLIGSTGAAPVAASLTAGSGITITPAAGVITIATTGLQASTLADGKIWVGQTGTPTAVTPGGDVTMTNAGVYTVGKIQGTAISATTPTTSGQVLRYNGSSWTPNFVSMFDLRSTITGTQAFSGVGCTPGQTLTWTVATDNLSCSTIAISDSQITYGSQTANTFLAAPSGSSGAPAYRTIAAADLPSGTLSGAGTAGYVPYYNAATTLVNSPMFISSGNVGIGTASPAAKLDVLGAIRIAGDSTACSSANAGAIRFNSTISMFESCDGTRWGSFAGETIPANSIILMKACAAGWTDTGATGGGPGAVTCGGTTCRRCQSPADASLIPANSVLLMEACPTGWTSLGVAAGPASAGINIGYVSCTAPAQSVSLSTHARIFMETCPASWADIGAANSGPLSATCGASSCHICEPSQEGILQRQLMAYSGGDTGAGGIVSVSGGRGGATSGAGGAVSIGGGVPTDGDGGAITISGGGAQTTTSTTHNGGSITITGGAGISNGNGGNITLTPGAENGSGTPGYILLSPTSSGRVGIGTTSPQASLDVRSYMQLKAPAGTYEAGINFASNGVSTADTRYIVRTCPDVGNEGRFEILRMNPSTGAEIDRTTYNTNGTWSFPNAVGIQIVNPSYTLHVNGSVAGTSAYNNLSDARLKRNIANVPNALEKINSLRGVSFEWRKDEYPKINLGDRQELGVIAQEVEKVFPQAVSVDKNTGIRSVAYSMLIAPLIEATKEIRGWLLNHDREIASLKVEVLAVKAENEKLKVQALQEQAIKEKEMADLKARLDRLEKDLESK